MKHHFSIIINKWYNPAEKSVDKSMPNFHNKYSYNDENLSSNCKLNSNAVNILEFEVIQNPKKPTIFFQREE